jgi:hypothetical protein
LTDTTAAAPPQSPRKDLVEIINKMTEVGSVELKMNVPSEQRAALRLLAIDPLQGRLREVVFFDTPDLDLYRAGVAIRGRRTQGKDDDTVVKLRPCMPSDLAPDVRESPNMKVELDITRTGHVVSASLKGVRPAGTLTDVLAAEIPLRKFLTKEQRPFLEAHLPVGIGLQDVVPLGPIYVVLVKGMSPGCPHRFTIEQWHYPGQIPLVELSTKATPANLFSVSKEVIEFLAARGLTPTGEQEPKTRKALEFFAGPAAKQAPEPASVV